MVGEEIEEIRENLSHLECYLTSLRATTDTRLARLERLGPWSFPLPESRSFRFPSFRLGDFLSSHRACELCTLTIALRARSLYSTRRPLRAARTRSEERTAGDDAVCWWIVCTVSALNCLALKLASTLPAMPL